MTSNNGLPLVAPRVTPVLEPSFRPAVLANHAFQDLVRATPGSVPVGLALEQADGSIFRFETMVLPESHPSAAANAVYLERYVKFLLWSRGGWRIHVAGPASLAAGLASHYRDTPNGRFDDDLVGQRMFDLDRLIATRELPAERRARRRSDGTSRATGSASISVAAIGRSRPSSTARSCSATRRSGIRITSRTRSTTTTASWTRCGRPPRTCPASMRLAAARPAST
jgi:hypothetical protein